MDIVDDGEIITEVFHWNDSAGTAEGEIDFNGMLHMHPPYYFQSIMIHNVDTSDTLYVSFDRGSNWKAISAGDSISLVAPAGGTILVEYGIRVKASAAATTYESLFQIRTRRHVGRPKR